MLSNSKYVLLPTECETVIYQWFEGLQQRKQHVFLGNNGRALRAELRRASLFEGVLMSQGYLLLRQKFFTVHPIKEGMQQLALAIFAAVAVHAENNNQKGSFAAQLGEEKIKGNKQRYLSELRFKRLLQASSPEELTRQLIRAVNLRGGQGVNLFSLADSIFLWVAEWQQKQLNLPADPNPFKRNAVRWASDYFN